ncbi:hypothetical protein FXF65_12490 [Actinomadura syzygii]|uniref:Uncharacterized protein n=2 Tax=Actinomadura syzygii TaxID=1427538 RepID=A0A5D0U8Q4_9ACTN|nr:hypothetical protein FXF65_12490 [Actinomadura syzygii]
MPSVTLVRMSETPQDPAGTTHQFQNFANQAQPQKSGPNMAVIVGVAAVVAVVVILVVAMVAL